ncbi:aldehyde dehydrogenase family protein [Actinokineospora sp. G85]|uniref:aldehyde dehydrogenase family protein n=1 Tax=Actinokineospora sp. G85 TaxID=3406626 RepID=UPI003C753D62
MPTFPSALAILDALGANGTFRGTNREPITDVAGTKVAELSLVPRLFVQRCVRSLGKARPLPAAERAAALARAGELFTSGAVGGATAADLHLAVARVCGLPVSCVRAAVEQVGEFAATAADTALAALPRGAVADWRDPAVGAGSGVWVRRGEVFAVHAPANTPAVHAAWLEALALGYRVAVRPSRREPFTPYRLVQALRAAGFPDDHVVLLPTDHGTADSVVADADVAIAFGGDAVVGKYGDGPAVLPQGPGRSKILLGADVDHTAHLDVIVESVAGQAGTGCVNATAVFVEGDPRPVAEAIAARLAELPVLPPQDERAALPVKPLAEAKQLDGFLRERRAGAQVVLGESVVADLGDDSAALTPAVYLLDRADAPQARTEMGFPCVWVAPWSRADGIAPLRDTLVLTVVTDDEGLLDALVADPTISTVHIGPRATTWKRPGLPHDGYLAGFLMRAKTVSRTDWEETA